MKKSAIQGIFKGERGHIETMRFPKEKSEYMKIVSDAYDELKGKISPELLKLLEKFSTALDNHWSEEVDFFFVEGFKLGVLIGIECMED